MLTSELIVVGKRHTIVIPKSIRERVKLVEGQRLIIRVEGQRLIIEPLPQNPYRVLGEVVGQPYNEEVDEKKAEKWLKEHAGC